MIFFLLFFSYFLKLLPFTLLEELEMQVLLALKALAKSTPAQLFRVELGNPWLFWLLSEHKSHSRRCRILLGSACWDLWFNKSCRVIGCYNLDKDMADSCHILCILLLNLP